MTTARIYKRWVVARNDRPGYALRWTAWSEGRRLSADTLAGLKRLINENH